MMKTVLSLSLALAVCCVMVSAAPGTATMQCNINGKLVNVGESHSYQVDCASVTCTCDPKRNDTCKTTMTGCLDDGNHKCYKVGESASLKIDGQEAECVCSKKEDGDFIFNGCKINGCPDLDGSYKKTGEKVRTMMGEEVYVCDCAGKEGYVNCMSKTALDNADKCQDKSGKYVEKGARYVVDFEGTAYNCECGGGNRGVNCMGA